jgi:hypothetical protein
MPSLSIFMPHSCDRTDKVKCSWLSADVGSIASVEKAKEEQSSRMGDDHHADAGSKETIPLLSPYNMGRFQLSHRLVSLSLFRFF